MILHILGKPACPQCTATLRMAREAGIAHEYHDLTAEPEWLARAEALGYRQVPICLFGADHWSGFQPARIRACADGTA